MAQLKLSDTYVVPKRVENKQIKASSNANEINGAQYLFGKLGSGAASMLLGTVNLVGGIQDQIVGDNYGAQKRYRENSAHQLSEKLDSQYDANGFMQFIGSAMEGIGQNIPRMALAFAAPYTAAGLAIAGYTGQGVEEAYKKTGTLGAKEYIYGIYSGTMDTALDTIGGKLGGWLPSGKVGASAVGKSLGLSTAKKILAGGASEFAEEFIESYTDVAMQRLTKIDPNAQVSLKEALYAGAVGFASGGILSGIGTGGTNLKNMAIGDRVMRSGETDTTVATAKQIASAFKSNKSKMMAEPIRILTENVAMWDNVKNKSGNTAKVILGNMKVASEVMNAMAQQAGTIEKVTQSPEKFLPAAKAMFGEQVTLEDLKNPDGQYTRGIALIDYATGLVNSVDQKYNMSAYMQELDNAMKKSTTPKLTETAWNGGDAVFSIDGGAVAVHQNPNGSYNVLVRSDGKTEYIQVDGNVTLDQQGVVKALDQIKATMLEYASNNEQKQDEQAQAEAKEETPEKAENEVEKKGKKKVEKRTKKAATTAEQTKEEAAEQTKEEAPAETTQETAQDAERSPETAEAAEQITAEQAKEEATSEENEKPAEEAETEAATQEKEEPRRNELNDTVKKEAATLVEQYSADVQDKARKFVKDVDMLSAERRVAIYEAIRTGENVESDVLAAVASYMAGQKGLYVFFNQDLKGAEGISDLAKSVKGRMIALTRGVKAIRDTVAHEIFHDIVRTGAGQTLMDYALANTTREALENTAREYGSFYGADYDAFKKGQKETDTVKIVEAFEKSIGKEGIIFEEAAAKTIGAKLGTKEFMNLMTQSKSKFQTFMRGLRRFARLVRTKKDERPLYREVIRLENLYLASAKAAGIMNEVQSRADETRYSIQSFSNALGIDATRNEDGTVTFTVGGKEVKKVTDSMVKDSRLYKFIALAKKNGFISEEDVEKQAEFVKSMMQMLIESQDAQLTYAFSGSMLFSAVKDNADKQYKKTIDFEAVCKKTEQMVAVMSEAMMRKGAGLTLDEINALYSSVIESKETVPCPACYVFARWIGIGGLLGNIADFQNRYRNYTREQLEEEAKRIESTITAKEGETLGKARSRLISKYASDLEKLISKRNDAIDKKDTKKILELDKQYEALNKSLVELRALSWIREVRMAEGYKEVPKNILFNLRAGEEFAGAYPETWKYRTGQGAYYGKAITPYTDERLGEVTMGMRSGGVKDTINIQNNPFKDIGADFDSTQNRIIKAAQNEVKRQNLRGGVRFQSFSDFRYEYALDYIQALFELQALGAGVQTYTKVVEAVNFLASTGAFVNMSLMPDGKGVKDGKLIFNNIIGIDADSAFALQKEFETAGTILMTISDEHTIAAMADDRIYFIIPYHKSGGRSEVIREMLKALGIEAVDYEDFSFVQSETFPKQGTNAAADLRAKILTEDRFTPNAQEQAILDENPFLQSLYDRKYKDKSSAMYGVNMKADDTKQIFPYEYWDATTTFENADENGRRYLAYCETLGVKPKFSGDRRGNHDFTGYKGYWKLLIDRRMYGNDGKYLPMQSVNATSFNFDQLDAKKAYEKFGDAMSKKADLSKTNEIVDRVFPQNERDDTRYAITPAQDRAYLTLAEKYKAGTATKEETAELDRMVREAARGSGFDSPELYHGTDYWKDITVFKRGKSGYLGSGIYFTDDKARAKSYSEKSGYGGKVYAVYLKMKNPLYVSDPDVAKEILRVIYGSDRVYNRRIASQSNFSMLIEKSDLTKLQQKGYDGIVWKLPRGIETEYSVFDPNQIKSADPVTYDNDGNIIPLSERFNSERDDIRYSLGETQARAYGRQDKTFTETDARDMVRDLNKVLNEGEGNGVYRFGVMKMGKLLFDKMNALWRGDFYGNIRAISEEMAENATYNGQKLSSFDQADMADYLEGFLLNQYTEKGKLTDLGKARLTAIEEKKMRERSQELISNAFKRSKSAVAIERISKSLRDMVNKRSGVPADAIIQQDMQAAAKELAEIGKMGKLLSGQERAEAEAQTKENEFYGIYYGEEVRKKLKLAIVAYERYLDTLGDEGKEGDAKAYLDMMKEIYNGKGALSADELYDLSQVMRVFRKAYTEYGTVLWGGKRVGVAELAEETVKKEKDYAKFEKERKGKFRDTLKAVGKMFQEMFLFNAMTPKQVFKTLDYYDPNGFFTKMWGVVQDARAKADADYATMFSPLMEYMKEHKGYEKRLASGTINYQGKKLYVGQALSLYLTTFREQAQLGLETNGFFVKDGREKINFAGRPVGEIRAEIESQLTGEDEGYIKLLVGDEYKKGKISKDSLFGQARELKEQTDYKMYGASNVIDGFYFPIIRDDSTIRQDIENYNKIFSNMQTVVGRSFNKNTAEGAKNALYIEDVTYIADDHAKGVANYANLAIPYRMFNSVWNQKVDADGVQTTLRSVIDDSVWNRVGAAERYIAKLFSDVAGARRTQDVGDKLYNYLRSSYVSAALGLNLSSILKQWGSFGSALIYVSPSDLAKGIALGKVDYDDVVKYSNVAKGRLFQSQRYLAEGNIDRNAFRGSTFGKGLQKVSETLTAPMEMMDRVVSVGRMWNAARAFYQRTEGLDINSEENKVKAGKLLDQIINNTQSTATQDTRSAFQRSRNPIVQTFTMFTSDAVKMLSYLYEGIAGVAYTGMRQKMGVATEAEVKQAQKYALRSGAAFLSSLAIVVSIIQLIKTLLKKKREDNIGWDIGKDALGEALGIIPFVNQVSAFFMDGYEVRSFVMQDVNDLADGTKGVFTTLGKAASGEDVDSYEWARPFRKVVYTTGNIFGIPIRNANNYMTGLLKWISPSAGYGWESAFTQPTYSKDLSDAVAKGNDKLAMKAVELQTKEKLGEESEIAAEMLALYKEGYTISLPSAGTTKKTEVKAFNSVMNKADKAAAKMVASSEYNDLTDEEKAKAINNLYAKYADVAKNKTARAKSVLLMDAGTLMSAAAKISGFENTKKNPKSDQVAAYLNTLDISNEEKFIILWYVGYKNKTVVSQMEKIVKKSDLSDDDKQSILASLTKSDEE